MCATCWRAVPDELRDGLSYFAGWYHATGDDRARLGFLRVLAHAEVIAVEAYYANEH